MVVPVVLGATTFDFRPLRNEQSRLAKTLVLPSPRDKDDTAQTLEIEDDQTTPFKYPTFVKVRYDKEGSLPVFELWMKDNFDQEYKVSKESYDGGTSINPPAYPPPITVTDTNYTDPTSIGGATSTQDINDDPLVGGFLPQSSVNNSYAINPITGDVFRNAFWDHVNRVIKDADGDLEGTTGFDGERVGTIKFDGVTGLGLAAINTRIADISNAVEGVTKVLSVVGQNFEAVLSVVR